jgi:hypothetical protein
VIGWLCGKYLEGLPFRALGAWFTGGWAVHLIAGIIIGTATIALAVLLHQHLEVWIFLSIRLTQGPLPRPFYHR